VPAATTWLAVLGSVFDRARLQSRPSDLAALWRIRCHALVTLLISVTTIPLGYLVRSESISLRQSSMRA
jgi:hypothetical protein